MSSAQLPLPFEIAPSHAREDFLVGKPNEAAFAQIERWPRWLSAAQVLMGPEGSGKSHLAAIFAQNAEARTIRADHLDVVEVPWFAQARALVIEDADRFPPDERALFHLFNLVRESGTSLLITARVPPDGWGVMTPDLLSRLRSQPLLVLNEPDDALLAQLFVKLSADRQLAIAPDVLQFALQRIERSYRAVQQLVAAVDHETLIRKAPPTRKIVSDVIQKLLPSSAIGE